MLAAGLLFGDSGVLRYGCIYVSGRIQAFFSLPLRVPTAVRHIRFLLVRFFSGLPPGVGYFRKY